MKIFINPGHTPQQEIDAGIDWDCGACGFDLQENIVAFNIAKLTAKYLSVLDCSIKTFQSKELAAIVDVANYWDADIFVSIHCNAYDGNTQGTETIYYGDSVYGEKLATTIQRQIVSSLGTVDRGIKDKIAGGYDAYVVKYTHCPAVLVETAFIDNYEDNLLLKNNIDDFARAIARGITDYIALLPDVVDRPADKGF